MNDTEPKKHTHPTFWIVWSPQGTTPPKVRFPFRGAAVGSAKELAKSHPEQKFYVLRSELRTLTTEDEVIQQPWGLGNGNRQQLNKSEYKACAVALMHTLESPNLPEEIKPTMAAAMQKLAAMGHLVAVETKVPA